MRAGSLRHRVTIESKAEAVSAHGEMVDTWSTHATVFARIAPKSSTEGTEADQSTARRTHEVTIRSLSTVTADMRVVYGSRTFYLVGPPRNIEERGIMMVLDCEERT